MNKYEDWALKDLDKYIIQGSWDWEADYRFALAFGTSEEIKAIQDLNDSSSVAAFRVKFWELYVKKKITSKRLRALRSLVNQKLIKSWWIGTGPGGASEFGVNRTRAYGRY